MLHITWLIWKKLIIIRTIFIFSLNNFVVSYRIIFFLKKKTNYLNNQLYLIFYYYSLQVLGWAQAMPKFAADLVKYVQTFLERTYERCRTSYMEAWLFLCFISLLLRSLDITNIIFFLDNFLVILCCFCAAPFPLVNQQ